MGDPYVFIAFDIGAEDSGEFTPKTFFCHNGTPLFKVSNKGTKDMDYSTQRRIRWELYPILQMKNRFRSAGIGESGIIYIYLYPNQWALVKYNQE